jgi:Skp family chaperone for outer membrane proteins
MRRLLRAGGVVLILGTLVLVGRSWSETKTAPAPRTKVALINLAQVVKNYDKVKAFQNETKAALQHFQEKSKELQKQIETHTKEMQKSDLEADQREKLGKSLRKYQRQLEDLSNDAKTTWTKKNDEQMVILYKEVVTAAQRYGAAHGFELVLHYNDAATDQPDYWHPGNVTRKLQAGACIPMHIASGMDITKEVVTALNDGYRQAKKASE